MTQEGHPTPLPRERLLRSLRVVCIPIGNPSGRARAPVQYWCDQIGTDDRYLYAYGALRGGERFPMVSLFHRSEHDFDSRFPMPLRFEQVADDTFIEPFFASVPLGSIDVAEYRGMCGRAAGWPATTLQGSIVPMSSPTPSRRGGVTWGSRSCRAICWSGAPIRSP